MNFAPVVTRGYDNLRSNYNPDETRLTRDFVRQYGVRRQFTINLFGDARGTEGQPLLVPNVAMSDGLNHDILLVASMGNIVHAFDANHGTLLWARRIGNPIKGTKQIDSYQINDYWGVLSTPVISPDLQEIYCVAWSSPDQTFQNAHFYFHSLRLRDGAPVFPPLSLDGVVRDPGNGLPAIKFTSAARKQRCALGLQVINNRWVVFIATGSVYESLKSNKGWVLAVDVSGNAPEVTGVWCATNKGSGGGIWMAGQGPAIIDNKLYLMTGNGAFDGANDFGECLVELTYKQPAASPSAALNCSDWWSPFSDTGREGVDPTRPQLPMGHGDYENENASNMNGWDDMDLGSGGLAVVPDLGYAIGAGKDGIAYVLKLGNFGKTQPGDFAPANIAKNYNKPSWIGWFTYFNADITPTPSRLTELNTLGYGRTRHQHSTPVIYDSANHGKMVFCWGENSQLRAWTLTKDGKLNYLACSQEIASPQAPVPPGGMPGGMMSMAGPKGNAVLWASVPYQDANKQICDGRLLAYDPENFVRFPGSNDMQIVKLWDSQDWGITYTHNKFNVMTAANGRIYLPTYSGTIEVLG